MITGIHHVSIIASSEESVEFYSKFGFKEHKRVERKYDTVVLMYAHGIGMEIFLDPSHPPRATQPENLGLRQLSLRVDNLEKTIDELKLEAGPIIKDWVASDSVLLLILMGYPFNFMSNILNCKHIKKRMKR